MEIQFSVIIPVYNAVKYVRMSIESVLNQTFKNFELIIIDDGSTDGSGKICDELEQEDSRIRVFRTKNQGISCARNVGLEKANGKYVLFCDHDDMYCSDLLENVLLAIEQSGADVIKYSYEQKGDHFSREIISYCKKGIWNMKSLCQSYKDFLAYSSLVWTGAYRTELAKKVKFDESFKTGNEDYDFNIRMLPLVNKVYMLGGKPYYVHFLRTGQSTSTMYNKDNLRTQLHCSNKEYELFTRVLKFEENKGVFAIQKARYITAIASNMVYRKGCKLNFKEKCNVISLTKKCRCFSQKIDIKGYIECLQENKKQGALLIMYEYKMIWLMLSVMYINKWLNYRDR